MNDAILVINSGSSSLKFVILAEEGNSITVEGIAEGLGFENGQLSIKFNGQKSTSTLSPSDHKSALMGINEWLEQHADIKSALTGIGHRVVHGGEFFSSSVLINNSIIQTINECTDLAPLHNPAHLKGIDLAQSLFPSLPQVAVFDTAFHQTLTKEQYLYGIPMRLYKEHHVRKYGFHGTSYRYISQKLGEIQPESLHQGVLVAHLGNGASVCAIQNGQSTDTSMGFTPLDGLIMGTRSGSIDPSLIAFIAEKDDLTLSETTNILNKESGLLGISELSNDCRTLEEAMQAGNNQATLALDMFASRAAKQLMSAATTLTTINHLVFTGGIGENSQYIRNKITDYLSAFNIQIDKAKNSTVVKDEASLISNDDQAIQVWVIPTNEEKMIALDTLDLITKKSLN